MSVVGIDFGNESCCIAVARHGGIETVDNDYSLRATPSCVAFNNQQRILGVGAKNQMITNYSDTIYNFKRLLGRTFNDSYVHELLQRKSYKVVETELGRAGVLVNYLGEPHVFSVEQITAMLFTKLKQTTEAAVGVVYKDFDCVVSVPSYFTNSEREALLDACSIAGFNVLRLMNDTAASALNYAFYKQDLPQEEEPPRYVAFVDCGHSALQVFIAAFSKGKMKILASTADPYIGGQNFDNIIAFHLVEEFKKKYKLDASTNYRALIRLFVEAEKLKKQFSANSTPIPLNIECFMNDIDVATVMCRAEFEVNAGHLFHKVEATMNQCLLESGLKAEEIHSIEIIGGSTRIPAIKRLIEKVFKKPPSTTLNQDESVARGCAIQCAMLSPSSRVRDAVEIQDLQLYPIKILYDEPLETHLNELVLFPKKNTLPSRKKVIFHKKDKFTLRASYDSDIPYPTLEIGLYNVLVEPRANGESMKVKLEFAVDMHGVFSVTRAIGYEKKKIQPSKSNPSLEIVPMETDVVSNGSDQAPSAGETILQETSNPIANGEKETPKEEYEMFDVPIKATSFKLPRDEITRLKKLEIEMVAKDRKEQGRIDSKNALEEYIYFLRSKLEDGYNEVTTQEEKSNMISSLNVLEDWLYDAGKDQEESVYKNKLNELEAFQQVMQQKQDEYLKKRLEEEAKLKPQEAEEQEPNTSILKLDAEEEELDVD